MGKRAAFVTSYKRGHDELEPGADHKTYSIDESFFEPMFGGETSWHYSKIRIYGDEGLRDRILAALQGETK